MEKINNPLYFELKSYFKPILAMEYNDITRALEMAPKECLRHLCSCLVAGISNNRYLNQRKYYYYDKEGFFIYLIIFLFRKQLIIYILIFVIYIKK